MPMKYPVHPGRIIQTDMEALGMDITQAAQELGVSAEQLRSVINGQAGISLAMAEELNKLFGGGASTWYQLQTRYDEAQQRNKDEIPEEPEPLASYSQTATVPLEHGRLVYTTYDDEVIAFRVVPPKKSKLLDSPNRDHLEFHFVGEGPGAVRIQLIYHPSPSTTPQVIADVLFKAYLEWDSTPGQYVGRIDAAEWNRKSEILKAGIGTMNDLHEGLRDRPSSSAIDTEGSAGPNPENYADVLREAEDLLHKGTASVSATALASL